jgi:hypothetical protein
VFLLWLLACAIPKVPAPEPIAKPPLAETFPKTHYTCPTQVAIAADDGLLHPDTLPLIEDLSAVATIEWPADFAATEELIFVKKSGDLRDLQRKAAAAARASEDPRFQRSVLLVQGAAYMVQAGLVLDSPEPPHIPEERRGGWREHTGGLHDALVVQATQCFEYMEYVPGRKRAEALHALADRCTAEIRLKMPPK